MNLPYASFTPFLMKKTFRGPNIRQKMSVVCKVRGWGLVGLNNFLFLEQNCTGHSSETKICTLSCMAENGRCPSKVFIRWKGHQEMSVYSTRLDHGYAENSKISKSKPHEYPRQRRYTATGSLVKQCQPHFTYFEPKTSV